MNKKFNKQSNWWALYIADNYLRYKNVAGRYALSHASHKFLDENYTYRVPNWQQYQELITEYITQLNKVFHNVSKNVDKALLSKRQETKPHKQPGLWEPKGY